MLRLEQGFYIVDGERAVRTKHVTKGKPGSEERRIVEEPVKFRTWNQARDVLTMCPEGSCVLYVPETGAEWVQGQPQ